MQSLLSLHFYLCRSLAAFLAANLKGAMAAYQTFSQLSRIKPRRVFPDLKGELDASDTVADAVQRLTEVTSTDSGRRIVMATLACHPRALDCLLAIMRVRRLRLHGIQQALFCPNHEPCSVVNLKQHPAYRGRAFSSK